MSRQHRIRQWLAFAGLASVPALLLAACGSESVSAVEPSIVVISPGEETLYLAETREFSAEVQDADGNALPDREVEWTSSDPDVASVNGDGVVEAHAEGTAEIRASFEGLTGTAAVTVLDRPTIVLSETSVTLQSEAGEAVGSEEEIEVSNGGDREVANLALDVSYGEDERDGWLEASLEEPTTPTTLTLGASAADLPGGTYRAQVDVVSDSAGNSPQTVEITFQVGASEPVIQLSADEVEFNAIEGRPRPVDRTVSIENGGEQDLTGLEVNIFYREEDPADGWLNASLNQTEAPAELTLSVADNGLVAGDYEANVRVESDVAINSPASILVSLHVQAGADPETSTIEADPEELVADGSAESVITVTLKDASGENLSIGGDDVTLTSTAGTLSDVTDKDDGTYTATLTSSSTPEVATITGTVNGQDIVDDATVTFAVGSVSTSNSTVAAEPVTLVADGVSTSTITVTVRDAQNNLREGGDDVALQASAGAMSAVTDNANGTYTATLTASTTAETATVTASVNGNDLDEGVDVAFVPGDPSPQTSTIAADPDSIDADGESTSTITVTVMDAHGNVRAAGGDAVVISSTGGTVSAVTDEGDGTYTATLTSGTTVGTAIVTATVNGIPLTESAAVQFGPAPSSAAQSSIEANPARVLLGATSTITVTVRDDFGNVRVTGGDAVGLQASVGRLSRVTDNENGTYTARFTARGRPPLRTAIINGTVNGADIQDTAEVTYILPLDEEDAGASAPELEASESVA